MSNSNYLEIAYDLCDGSYYKTNHLFDLDIELLLFSLSPVMLCRRIK